MEGGFTIANSLNDLVQKLRNPDIQGSEKISKYGPAILEQYRQLVTAVRDQTSETNKTKELNKTIEGNSLALAKKVELFGTPTKDDLNAEITNLKDTLQNLTSSIGKTATDEAFLQQAQDECKRLQDVESDKLKLQGQYDEAVRTQTKLQGERTAALEAKSTADQNSAINKTAMEQAQDECKRLQDVESEKLKLQGQYDEAVRTQTKLQDERTAALEAKSAADQNSAINKTAMEQAQDECKRLQDIESEKKALQAKYDDAVRVKNQFEKERGEAVLVKEEFEAKLNEALRGKEDVEAKLNEAVRVKGQLGTTLDDVRREKTAAEQDKTTAEDDLKTSNAENTLLKQQLQNIQSQLDAAKIQLSKVDTTDDFGRKLDTAMANWLGARPANPPPNSIFDTMQSSSQATDAAINAVSKQLQPLSEMATATIHKQQHNTQRQYGQVSSDPHSRVHLGEIRQEFHLGPAPSAFLTGNTSARPDHPRPTSSDSTTLNKPPTRRRRFDPDDAAQVGSEQAGSTSLVPTRSLYPMPVMPSSTEVPHQFDFINPAAIPSFTAGPSVQAGQLHLSAGIGRGMYPPGGQQITQSLASGTVPSNIFSTQANTPAARTFGGVGGQVFGQAQAPVSSVGGMGGQYPGQAQTAASPNPPLTINIQTPQRIKNSVLNEVSQYLISNDGSRNRYLTAIKQVKPEDNLPGCLGVICKDKKARDGTHDRLTVCAACKSRGRQCVILIDANTALLMEPTAEECIEQVSLDAENSA